MCIRFRAPRLFILCVLTCNPRLYRPQEHSIHIPATQAIGQTCPRPTKPVGNQIGRS
jgi:hypothetical protein